MCGFEEYIMPWKPGRRSRSEGSTMLRAFCRAFPVLWLPACGQNPVGDLQPSIAIVYGSVATQEGLPIAGAFVRVYVRDPLRCDGPVDDGWLGGGTTTDATGRYRARATYLHYSRIERCLAVRATAPASSGLGEATVTGALVTFIHEALTPPVDSVRVNVTLPPAQ